MVATSLLGACMPIPNRRCHAPAVSGMLVRNGMPVADAEVLLTSSFSDAGASARTSPDGRFKLGPLSRLYFTKGLLGDPLYKFSLRFKTSGGEEYLGLAGSGMGDAPRELKVVCDLGGPGAGGAPRGCCVPEGRPADPGKP